MGCFLQYAVQPVRATHATHASPTSVKRKYKPFQSTHIFTLHTSSLSSYILFPSHAHTLQSMMHVIDAVLIPNLGQIDLQALLGQDAPPADSIQLPGSGSGSGNGTGNGTGSPTPSACVLEQCVCALVFVLVLWLWLWQRNGQRHWLTYFKCVCV